MSKSFAFVIFHKCTSLIFLFICALLDIVTAVCNKPIVQQHCFEHNLNYEYKCEVVNCVIHEGGIGVRMKRRRISQDKLYIVCKLVCHNKASKKVGEFGDYNQQVANMFSFPNVDTTFDFANFRRFRRFRLKIDFRVPEMLRCPLRCLLSLRS